MGAYDIKKRLFSDISVVLTRDKEEDKRKISEGGLGEDSIQRIPAKAHFIGAQQLKAATILSTAINTIVTGFKWFSVSFSMWLI